jgi:hypothetical protein
MKHLILSMVMLSALKTMAQPYTMDKNIKPIELVLIDYKATGKDSVKNGKINLTSVTPKKDTMYYVVKGAGIYQPNKFTVSSKNKNVEIKICKNSWKKPDRFGTTKNGKWTTEFKTEGSYGVMIISKQKAPYQIFVWTGKAMRAKDFFKPLKTK